MKVIRVLEGERYTAAAGTGYMSATADEDGFEIDDRGAVFWVTDSELDAAIQERNRTIQTEEAASTVEPEPTDPKPKHYEHVLIPAPTTPPTRLELAEAAAKMAAAAAERCPRCDRPGSKGPCPFDCATCHRCGKKLDKIEVRLFTTGDHVYCMDCGTHA